MTSGEIIAWLSTISDSDNKRKRQDSECRIPSPPFSSMDPEAEAGQQPKRIRTSGTDDGRVADTPVQLASFIAPAPIPPPPSSAPAAGGPDRASTAQTSTTGASSTCGGKPKSSARKRLRNLALQDDGIMTRSLMVPCTDMAPELRKLLGQMEDCGNGFGVVSNKRRQEIQDMIESQDTAESALSRSTYRVLAHTMCYPVGDAQQERREALGPTPCIQDVLPVLGWAARCTSEAAEEAMWNSVVHVPLLQLALYGGRGISEPQRQDDGGGGCSVTVELTQCTTARLIKEYVPVRETSGKHVDFCFHLDVDAAAQRAIDQVRASLPLMSINHFDMEGLVNRPVALSCESKRLDSSDRGATEAKLRIGIWHAAQWKLIKRLAGRRPDEQAQNVGFPAFLPAVIIAGHDWSFAATTQRQDKTVLWTDCPFGHTRDAAGVYKVVCGLQILSTWARDEYWPWYRRCVLGLT